MALVQITTDKLLSNNWQRGIHVELEGEQLADYVAKDWVKVIDNRPIKPKEEEVGEEDVVEVEEIPDLSWKKAEIVAFAQKYGFKTTGTKKELIDEIKSHVL